MYDPIARAQHIDEVVCDGNIHIRTCGSSVFGLAVYRDIVLVNRDGGRGYPELAPFDRISVTAACRKIPPPLLDQLRSDGRLIAPVQQNDVQKLVLVEKQAKGFDRYEICDVLYVALRGQYG